MQFALEFEQQEKEGLNLLVLLVQAVGRMQILSNRWLGKVDVEKGSYCQNNFKEHFWDTLKLRCRQRERFPVYLPEHEFSYDGGKVSEEMRLSISSTPKITDIVSFFNNDWKSLTVLEEGQKTSFFGFPSAATATLSSMEGICQIGSPFPILKISITCSQMSSSTTSESTRRLRSSLSRMSRISSKFNLFSSISAFKRFFRDYSQLSLLSGINSLLDIYQTLEMQLMTWKAVIAILDKFDNFDIILQLQWIFALYAYKLMKLLTIRTLFQPFLIN